MALFSVKKKSTVIVIVLIGLLMYVYPVIILVEGKKYHAEFKNTNFDKLSIEMYDNFTDERVETKITDRKA